MSLEDDLFVKHGAADSLPHPLREWAEGSPVRDPAAVEAIAHSQRVLEGQNLQIRKTLLRCDRLLEGQRQIFALRRDVASSGFLELAALFDDLLRGLDARVAGTFETAEVTAEGVDLGREGLAGPSSTWTCLVNDQPFGSTMERMAVDLVRFAKGMLRPS